MRELYKILCTHAKRYPKMEPVDAIKLIYQNEFGPGHFVLDSKKSFAYLKDEYAKTTKRENATLCEDIGAGLVRVHLNALCLDVLSLEKLNDAFVASANSHKGSVQSFESKLAILKAAVENKIFSFPVKHNSNKLVVL